MSDRDQLAKNVEALGEAVARFNAFAHEASSALTKCGAIIHDAMNDLASGQALQRLR